MTQTDIDLESTTVPERRTRVNGLKFLMDPYLDWAEAENVPIHEDFCVNLLAAEVAPWARSGTDAAIVHVKGRGDYASTFVHEVRPEGSSDQQSHLFEGVVYGLAGHGRASFELPGRSAPVNFEFGPRSIFAIPPNVRYRFYNMSGTQPLRFAMATNAPLLMNTFHNYDFIFNNTADFSARLEADLSIKGDGRMIENIPGRHMWVTNFVPDLGTFELMAWKERGAGGTNISFVLADSTMHAHVSEMPVGTYKKAHRHDAGVQIYPVTGKGYSLLWYAGEEEIRKVDWEHGFVYAPPDQMYHQHFNVSDRPSRYMATAFGNMRYPVTAAKADAVLGVDVDVKDGGQQIEYADQDPRVQEIWETSAKENGVTSLMSQFLGK